jgi:hypothetical protein
MIVPGGIPFVSLTCGTTRSAEQSATISGSRLDFVGHERADSGVSPTRHQPLIRFEARENRRHT